MLRIIFAVFFLFPSLVWSDAKKCESLKSEAQKLTCFKKEWKAKDKILNQVYQSLKKKLSSKEFEEMKTDSRQWIEKKETYCTDDRYTGSENASNKNSSYYDCILDFTEERIEFLRKGFGKEKVSKEISGSYSDGDGGRLEIKKTKKGYEFELICVRGVTSHTGNVEGIIPKIQKNYKWKHKEEGEECLLDFEFSDYTILVTEESCFAYHGANAYFSGKYRKMK